MIDIITIWLSNYIPVRDKHLNAGAMQPSTQLLLIQRYNNRQNRRKSANQLSRRFFFKEHKWKDDENKRS